MIGLLTHKPFANHEVAAAAYAQADAMMKAGGIE